MKNVEESASRELLSRRGLSIGVANFLLGHVGFRRDGEMRSGVYIGRLITRADRNALNGKAAAVVDERGIKVASREEKSYGFRRILASLYSKVLESRFIGADGVGRDGRQEKGEVAKAYSKDVET